MTSPAAASPSIFPPAWPLPTADHPFPSHLLWPKGSEGFSVLLGSDPDTLDIKEVAGGEKDPHVHITSAARADIVKLLHVKNYTPV